MKATWLKALVVAMGLGLGGGAAVAAVPTPAAPAAYGYGHGHWDPNDRFHDDDGFDAKDRRLYLLGRKKLVEAKELQEQAAALLRKARFEHGHRQQRLIMQAKNMNLRGERLEREGRALLRRARA